MKLFKTHNTGEPTLLREFNIHTGTAPDKPVLEILSYPYGANSNTSLYRYFNIYYTYLSTVSTQNETVEYRQSRRAITALFPEGNSFASRNPGTLILGDTDHIIMYAEYSIDDKRPTVYHVRDYGLTTASIDPEPIITLYPFTDAPAAGKTTEVGDYYYNLNAHVTQDGTKLILAGYGAGTDSGFLVEYVFGTPFDFSTLVFNRDLITPTEIQAERVSDTYYFDYEIAFYPDDSGFYSRSATDGLDGKLIQWKTSTPGDFLFSGLTVSYAPNTFRELKDVANPGATSLWPYAPTYAKSYFMSPDGSQLVFRTQGADYFAVLNLAVPYDVTSAVLGGFLSASGTSAGYDFLHHVGFTDSSLVTLEFYQTGGRHTKTFRPDTRLKPNNVLVTFNPDIELAERKHLAIEDLAENSKLVWDGGPLSALVPAGGGEATYFTALFEDNRGFTIPVIGTVGLIGSGADLEFSTTTFVENDVIELNTLAFALNGVAR